MVEGVPELLGLLLGGGGQGPGAGLHLEADQLALQRREGRIGEGPGEGQVGGAPGLGRHIHMGEGGLEAIRDGAAHQGEVHGALAQHQDVLEGEGQARGVLGGQDEAAVPEARVHGLEGDGAVEFGAGDEGGGLGREEGLLGLGLGLLLGARRVVEEALVGAAHGEGPEARRQQMMQADQEGGLEVIPGKERQGEGGGGLAQGQVRVPGDGARRPGAIGAHIGGLPIGKLVQGYAQDLLGKGVMQGMPGGVLEVDRGAVRVQARHLELEGVGAAQGARGGHGVLEEALPVAGGAAREVVSGLFGGGQGQGGKVCGGLLQGQGREDGGEGLVAVGQQQDLQGGLQGLVQGELVQVAGDGVVGPGAAQVVEGAGGVRQQEAVLGDGAGEGQGDGPGGRAPPWIPPLTGGQQDQGSQQRSQLGIHGLTYSRLGSPWHFWNLSSRLLRWPS